MIQKGGFWSPFEDIGSLTQEIQKLPHREKYGRRAEKKYAEPDKLMQQLFVRRKCALLECRVRGDSDNENMPNLNIRFSAGAED